jgi:hypothetical protein
MKTHETDFACNLTVLDEHERERFTSVTNALFAVVQETRELENGFAFRFLNQPGRLVHIAEFIERENQCCSFLRFSLDVEPASGPIWLHISGADGTKQFLGAELAQIQSSEKT